MHVPTSAQRVSRTPHRTRVLLGALTACSMGIAAVLAGGATASADVDTQVGAGLAAEPTEVVVRLDPAITTIDAVNAGRGTTTIATSSGLPSTYLLQLPAGVDADAAAEGIETMPGVVWAIANVDLTAPEIDEDRMYAWRMYAWSEGSAVPAVSAYALDVLRLDVAHRLSTGAGVTVAVVDSGVQGDHPALRGVMAGGIDLVDHDRDPAEGRNGLDDDGDGFIDEGAGHGTHVAGVIHQVAPDARILAVRVLDDEGTGSLWATAEGILWASANGARVVNASLGTHSSADLLKDVVETVTQRGTVVVGAAGNDGKDRRMFPGAADGAIAVTSVGPGDVRSTFANHGRWVTVAAPGEEIHSTFAFPTGSYAANSGTSMATPFVSGEAALVLAKRPGATPAQVRGVIRSTARNIDAANPGFGGELGSGRIDVGAAVAAA